MSRASFRAGCQSEFFGRQQACPKGMSPNDTNAFTKDGNVIADKVPMLNVVVSVRSPHQQKHHCHPYVNPAGRMVPSMIRPGEPFPAIGLSRSRWVGIKLTGLQCWNNSREFGRAP